jgi:predicted nuclease with TOPRIM domain
MKEQLEERLKELKAEYETGQARLRELETETNYVRETMLRISGAIQVMQELLEKDQPQAESAKPQDETVKPLQAGQAEA